VSIDRLLTGLNPLISLVLRSPLHRLLSAGLTLITVHGRRTGRRYAIPVGYQQDGDRLTILVSEARRKQWWRNYRSPGPIDVLLRGDARTGRAEVIAPSSEEFAATARATLSRMPSLGRVFGIPDYDRNEGLTPAQLDRLRTEIAAVRVTLDPPTG
jgi:F420H(2)-dependent quinone reductase